jgi:hypothetical protein
MESIIERNKVHSGHIYLFVARGLREGPEPVRRHNDGKARVARRSESAAAAHSHREVGVAWRESVTYSVQVLLDFSGGVGDTQYLSTARRRKKEVWIWDFVPKAWIHNMTEARAQGPGLRVCLSPLTTP